MKKLFREIYDVMNGINRLENNIDDLQKSIMKNQALIEDIKKRIIGLYDDLEDGYEELELTETD